MENRGIYMRLIPPVLVMFPKATYDGMPGGMVGGTCLSPAMVKNYIFVTSMSGVITCYEAKTENSLD